MVVPKLLVASEAVQRDASWSAFIFWRLDGGYELQVFGLQAGMITRGDKDHVLSILHDVSY